MARKRFSMRRFLLLVLVLICLFLLLEMNRWLPGGWPGGGGGGIRETPREGAVDASRVRPADEPVEWPPKEGVRIEVRGPDGDRVDGWKATAGREGEDPEGTSERLTDAAAFREGFRVRTGPWLLRHHPGPRSPAESWAVYVPASAMRAGHRNPAAPQRVVTRVVDATTGAPVANAEVHLVRDGSRRPLSVGRDGTVETTLRDDERAGAHLEVRVEGRPVAVARADALAETIRVPEGRVIEVKVTDAERRRPAGAAVTAHYAVRPAPGAEPIEASARAEAGQDGTVRIAVPADGAVSVLAESLDRAPSVRRLSAADGGAPVEVVLDPGLSVPVRVLGADGSGAEGAEVIAVASLQGVRVERRAVAGKDGRANVGPFAAGEVEVYAKAPGHAWAAATAAASSAMGTTEIRLAKGATLTLVVESPHGAPIEGAHVRWSAEEGGPDVTPPGAPAWTTDAQGTLVVPDLPERAFTLRISAPGHQPERLGRVRPGPVTYFATLAPE